MHPKSVLAIAAFCGSFAVSATVHPPPCTDCAVVPVPVIVVGTTEVTQDAGNPVLPKGVVRPSDLPPIKAIGDK